MWWTLLPLCFSDSCRYMAWVKQLSIPTIVLAKNTSSMRWTAMAYLAGWPSSHWKDSNWSALDMELEAPWYILMVCDKA